MSTYSYRTSYSSQQPSIVRFFAGFFSYLFHPLLVGLFMVAYVTYLQPVYFIGVDGRIKLQDILIYAFNGVFLPLFGVLLCRGLGFIDSIYLKTQKERIFPYTISIIFFFWTFYVFRHKPGTPDILAQVCLGIFLATSLSFILNIFYKVSMHAVSVGGLVGMMIAILYSQVASHGVGAGLVISVLIAGIVCSARLMLTDHSLTDIISGLIVGILTQLIAAWII